MRWMKRLLLSIYLYMGVFFAVCLIVWIITGNEPSALIMGISAAVGVESVAAGAIRVFENKQHHDHEKEMQDGQKYCNCDAENQLGGKIDEP